MSKADEAFEKWDQGRARVIGLGDAFLAGYLAGAAAEREVVLTDIREVEPLSISIDNFARRLRSRIRQRGEAGERPEEEK